MSLIAVFVLIFIVFRLQSEDKAKKYIGHLVRNWGKYIWTFFFIAIAIDVAGYKDTTAIGENLYNDMLLGFMLAMFAWPFVALFTKKFRKQVEKLEEDYIDIPDSLSARTKIVSKFSEEFNLNLTDEEIKRIVDGSYGARLWAKEIEAMDKHYDTPSQWYAGETAWLRAYLKAFNVQNVSSDFGMQKSLCLGNFNEVFASLNTDAYYSVDDCIRYINNKFFTNFDEITFMIAHRFLMENGKRYPLPSGGIVKATSDIEELANKYEKMRMQ